MEWGDFHLMTILLRFVFLTGWGVQKATKPLVWHARRAALISDAGAILFVKYVLGESIGGVSFLPENLRDYGNDTGGLHRVKRKKNETSMCLKDMELRPYSRETVPASDAGYLLWLPARVKSLPLTEFSTGFIAFPACFDEALVLRAYHCSQILHLLHHELPLLAALPEMTFHVWIVVAAHIALAFQLVSRGGLPYREDDQSSSSFCIRLPSSDSFHFSMAGCAHEHTRASREPGPTRKAVPLGAPVPSLFPLLLRESCS